MAEEEVVADSLVLPDGLVLLEVEGPVEELELEPLAVELVDVVVAGPETEGADSVGTVVLGPGSTGFAHTPPLEVPPLGSVIGPH